MALPSALRAIVLVRRTAPTDPDFVTAQALTIQTHFLTGLGLTLALFDAAWWLVKKAVSGQLSAISKTVLWQAKLNITWDYSWGFGESNPRKYDFSC